MPEKPTIIKGGNFADQRGIMRFVNDFRFNDVKRFYFIKHPDTEVVRAWQGHQFEKKYFYPISGSFIVAWVKIDDFINPSKDLIPEYHILSASTSEIISIPTGYANGLKALEPDSEILIFSDMNLEDSINEKIRFPAEWWMDWKTLELKHTSEKEEKEKE
jgi:dTDP-4-dehydrorhamnose 3,5-epimerase